MTTHTIESHGPTWLARVRTRVKAPDMFTGLVGDTTRVLESRSTDHLGVLVVRSSPYLTEGLTLGASVAVNGVCLTVVDIEDEWVGFDVVGSTIEGTTLPHLSSGDIVNLERSLSLGSEMGGHDVSGHVDCTATVHAVDDVGGGVAHVEFELPENYRAYVFRKGFVAVDGVSLTVSEVSDAGFCVWLIPETRRSTRFEGLRVGAAVNVEFGKNVQVVVDTLRRAVAELAAGGRAPLGSDERKMIADLLELDADMPSLRPGNEQQPIDSPTIDPSRSN